MDCSKKISDRNTANSLESVWQTNDFPVLGIWGATQVQGWSFIIRRWPAQPAVCEEVHEIVCSCHCQMVQMTAEEVMILVDSCHICNMPANTLYQECWCKNNVVITWGSQVGSSIQQEAIWTFSESLSQVMKLCISCIIPKVNDNPPCGRTHHH
jgi:hypothetical protein